MESNISHPGGTMPTARSAASSPSEVRFAPSASSDEANSSGVSWAAIAGGAVAGTAVSVILFALGSGLGLATVSPWTSATSVAAGSLVWLVVTQVLAGGLGGYLSGRLRTRWTRIHNDEVFFRDTAHGLLVWAVGVVLTASLLAASASWLVRTGVAMADGRDGTALSTSYFADRLLRPESSASSARTDDAQLRAEFERTLQVQALTGTLSSDDRAYLARQVSRSTGLSPADAQARVGAVSADIERGRIEARNHADRARKDAAHFSLWFALALLTGAFSASIAATLGGKQRDRVESPETRH